MKKNSTDSRKAHAMLTVSRVLVYALLIFLSILCLFSFYMLIVNASRTNADLQGGFKALPQGHFLENLKNAWNDSSINIPRGMLNSFIIAAATAILSTYFSALTAYGLHAYHLSSSGSHSCSSWPSWSSLSRSPPRALSSCATS